MRGRQRGCVCRSHPRFRAVALAARVRAGLEILAAPARIRFLFLGKTPTWLGRRLPARRLRPNNLVAPILSPFHDTPLRSRSAQRPSLF
jgi:hypothetical protein